MVLMEGDHSIKLINRVCLVHTVPIQKPIARSLETYSYLNVELSFWIYVTFLSPQPISFKFNKRGTHFLAMLQVWCHKIFSSLLFLCVYFNNVTDFSQWHHEEDWEEFKFFSSPQNVVCFFPLHFLIRFSAFMWQIFFLIELVCIMTLRTCSQGRARERVCAASQ